MESFPILARIFATATFVNFIVFCAGALFLGGDALNGRVEEGRYYLSMYGRLTEVTHGVYTYSRWHAISVILSVACVLVWYLSMRLRKPDYAR
jgi:hypothetical protein